MLKVSQINLCKVQLSINQLVQRANNFRSKFNGSYWTKSLLLKEFSGRQRNFEQKINTKNMKRDLRRQIFNLYFSPDQNKFEKRKTSNIMSTSGFLLQMQKRQGFKKLLQLFSEFDKFLSKIFLDQDKKKLFIQKYSVCELVLIIVDLLELKNITFQYIKNPQSLHSHLRVNKDKKKLIKKQVQQPDSETLYQEIKEQNLKKNKIIQEIQESDVEEIKNLQQNFEMSINFKILDEEKYQQNLNISNDNSSSNSITIDNEEEMD